jgi:hypothetical protein
MNRETGCCQNESYHTVQNGKINRRSGMRKAFQKKVGTTEEANMKPSSGGVLLF